MIQHKSHRYSHFAAKALAYSVALLIMPMLSANASTYYFSSKIGNDEYTSSQALNPATPWKTLDKLNNFFRYLTPGDSVLFKRGDTFYGSINVSKSGTYFAPIVLGAYGKGTLPQINGFATLTNWKFVKKGIFEAPCISDGLNVLVNGSQKAMGRYPNKGYLTIKSHFNNYSFIDNEAIGTANWTGAEVVMKKARWVIDKSAISNHSGNLITFADGNNYAPKNGYGYFIQKSINTLDQPGEWYYDAAKKTMSVFFGDKHPASFDVKVSIASNLVTLRQCNYLVFTNLEFKGAGKNAFNLVQAKGITVEQCCINNSGTEAILASYSEALTVADCEINNSLSGGINLDGGCISAKILNNNIKNTGLLPGMGKSGTGTYEAITSFGDNTTIEKNKIDSIGYNGIYFGGNYSTAKNNYITFFCLTKDDGAGIYLGDWSKTTGKKVIGNIILHGVGNGAGTNAPRSLQAEGIYVDDNTESVDITDNTVSLCANNGIKVHNAKDININSNIVFNNGVQLRLEQDHYLATSKYIRNNKISKNTFFSLENAQLAAKFTTNQDDIPSFGKIDSNIYCRPKAAHRMASVNSTKTPLIKSSLVKPANQSTTVSDDKILFEFNASNEVKTIVLNTHYVDLQNKHYEKTVNINPYSSVILIASTPEIANDNDHVEYSSVINKTHER
jgi:parallel beta-helix repeat protein